MTVPNVKLVTVIAKRDQAWATLREHFNNIECIANEGPQLGDESLIQMVFKVVKCDLILRKLDID